MSTEHSFEAAEPASDEDAGPSELESALLTLVLFGGLVVFAVGCMLFLW